MSRPPLLCEEGNVLSHELAKLKLSHYPSVLPIDKRPPAKRQSHRHFQSLSRSWPDCQNPTLPALAPHPARSPISHMKLTAWLEISPRKTEKVQIKGLSLMPNLRVAAGPTHAGFTAGVRWI